MRTRKPSKSAESLANFISSMKSCAPSDAPSMLQAAAKAGPEVLIATASGLLCGLCPNAPRIPGSVEVPLDSLVSCDHPLAARATFHFAAHAQIGRVRLEAIRRLGPVAHEEGARQFLRKVAKEGASPGASFSNDAISQEDFQVAAVESLGKLKTAADADAQFLVDIIATYIETQKGSGVVQTAIASLPTLCKPANLGPLLSLAEKCRDPFMKIKILGGCSNLSRNALLEHQKPLIDLFVSGLGQFRDEKPLRERLIPLAKKICCTELVRRLSDSYSVDNLADPRGSISGETLDAYASVDDTLTDAYLAFARTPSNVSGGSRCINGLIRCAKAEKADRIVNRVIRQDAPGYQHVLKAGLLSDIVGSVPAAIDLMCSALQREANQQQLQQYAKGCYYCVLAMSLASAEKKPDLECLDNIRIQYQRHERSDIGPLVEAVDSLRKCDGPKNALRLFAEKVVSDKPSGGAVAIAEHLVAYPDVLTQFFLDLVLRLAVKTVLANPGGFPLDSPLLGLEKTFGNHDRWLREQLPKITVVEGKLNRYVLDLMRRRDVEFVKTCEAALDAVKSADDAFFVLESLAARGKQDSIRVIGKAVGFVSNQCQSFPQVRAKAIDLIRQLLDKSGSQDINLVTEVLPHLHGRFEDPLAVRLVAYGACSSLANVLSIKPLRARLTSDKNPQAQEAINAALTSIGKRLMDARPSTTDADSSIKWLGHVADLGDEAFVVVVANFLSPPHSDRRVLLTTLNCLERLGHESAITAIEQFVADTSPSNEVLHAARHARAVLQGRNDLELLEVLAKIFDDTSPVLDPKVDYEKVFGLSRMKHLAKGLSDALGERDVSHWEDFVTRLDGICDILNRHLFDRHWSAMKLSKEKASAMSMQNYGNRLPMAEFRNRFPVLQPLMQTIHDMRYDATTAHPEDSDGTGKPGLEESDATLAIEQFKKLFTLYVEAVTAQQPTV